MKRVTAIISCFNIKYKSNCRSVAPGLKNLDRGATFPYVLKKCNSQRKKCTSSVLIHHMSTQIIWKKYHEILHAIFYCYRYFTCLRLSLEHPNRPRKMRYVHVQIDSRIFINKLHHFPLRNWWWCLEEYQRQVKWQYP